MGLKRILLNMTLAALAVLVLVAVEVGCRYTRPPVDPMEQASPRLAVRLNSEHLKALDLVARKLSRSRDRESARALDYDHYIDKVAKEQNISAALVKAVMHAESQFNPRIVSPRGAVGLMQVLPATASMIGVEDLYDPHENIRAGARYLRELLEQFNGDEVLAVAAYNCGPGAVRKYNGVPPFRETRAYVRRVLAYYRTYLET